MGLRGSGKPGQSENLKFKGEDARRWLIDALMNFYLAFYEAEQKEDRLLSETLNLTLSVQCALYLLSVLYSYIYIYLKIAIDFLFLSSSYVMLLQQEKTYVKCSSSRNGGFLLSLYICRYWLLMNLENRITYNIRLP